MFYFEDFIMMNLNASLAMQTNQHLLQQVQKVHQKLEDLRLRLNEPIVPLTNEAILHLSTELQPLYKALVMYNLDEFISRNLETALWNDCFKTPLTRYGRTDKNLFNLMIESGVGFYLGLIQDIGVNFDISFITNTPPTSKLYCTTSMLNNHFIKPSKSSIYFIIQNCLLHVGDLLRYRGSSYPEAIKMYEKSAAVCPSNGYPYHQMGLTQLVIATTTENAHLMDELVSCLYYFARSLAVSNRYLPAFQSIENLIKTKVEVTKQLPKNQEMLRQFMVSIHENSKTANLYQMMCSVIATEHKISASTLVKMIVIALWNNWRNQFTTNSLDIIACILNTVIQAASVVVDFQPQSTLCLPHLKLILEWMNWHCDNAAMPYLYSKLSVGKLVGVLNYLQTGNHLAQSSPGSWVLEAILPEEKKLIGFIPLDYSVCFNAGSSAGAIEPPTPIGTPVNSQPPRQAMLGGHLLSEDKDAALSQSLRIHRIVAIALKLASNKRCFMYDGVKFVEKTATPVPTQIQQPSRRNVALQSIFRTANVEVETQDLSPTSSFIPSNTTLPAMTAPGSLTTTTNLTTSHDFFRSIWTPDTENTESNWN
ncbi:Protein SMG7 [Orchesella cincta]|uniref:Protein SMG7 n=1 Tax=Orchesella cincta TaxID=48709 RepID=A0A1D2N1N2_ORCCI|nr:Protein SMG7 [Orchesella cincta]